MNSPVWVFLNGERGIAAVRGLVEAGRPIAALVAPVHKAAAFHQLASEISAQVYGPHSVNDPDFVAVVREMRPQIGICAGFSTIFCRSLIDAFDRGIINLHAGRVPQYRGGSPLNWQIINGEKTAGLSALMMTDGIDDGSVLASTEIPITEDDDIAAIHQKANEAFPDVLLQALSAVDANSRGIPQDHRSARYWLQRNDEDGAIDWPHMTAAEVHRMVRALTRPYPGAHSSGTRIWRTSITDLAIHGRPGRVSYIQGQGPFVCCSDRAIKIEQWSGKKLRHGSYLIADRSNLGL